jgi:hypothetical protein
MVISCVIISDNPHVYIPRHFLERETEDLRILNPIYLIINEGPKKVIVDNLVSTAMYPGLFKAPIQLNVNLNNNSIMVGDCLILEENEMQLRVCKIL